MPTISQLPVASVVNSGDLMVIVQSGVTKQATQSLVVGALGLGTMAYVNSPAPAANGGTGVASPTIHTLPVAQGSSAFHFLGPLTNGQLLIGSTGADPVAAAITAGTNVTVSNTAGGIQISATGGAGLTWTHVTGTTQTMSGNSGYVPDNVALVTLTLPATSSFGDELYIAGRGSGGWTVSQAAGQQIIIGSSSSTVGVAGSVASTDRRDSIYLVCTAANTEWTAVGGPQGALTIV